jgi:hypothetical protein
VIDLDSKNGLDGIAWWNTQVVQPGAIETATARTPSGGKHVYFNAPELREIPPSAGKVAPGVDVRADGSYIIVPPSRSTAGQYEWITPPDAGIAPMLEWLIGLTAKPGMPAPRPAPRPIPIGSHDRLNRYFRAALERAAAEVAVAENGCRNDALNRAAYGLGKLVGVGLPLDIAIGVLLGATELPEQEARQTIRSGMEKGRLQPRVIS